MLRTPETRFRVVSTHRHHVWFEVLFGDDQGMRVSIPLRHESYSDDVAHCIQHLQGGDVVQATLISDTEDRPNWRVETIQNVGELPA